MIGIETDVPTRDVLVWDTLNATLSEANRDNMFER